VVESIHIWLTAGRKPGVLYTIAGLIGLGVAIYLLGWAGIQGTSEYWTNTHNDSVQSIAGLRYYLSEGWGWPLLHIDSYGYPDGTNLILTDSIPALAVVSKLFSGALSDGFHYFGYWMAFCFVAQGVAMVGLLVALGWRSYTTAIVGAGLAVSQTALLTRFFHAALMAHFLLIVAITIGVLAMKSDRPARQLGWFAVLLGVTFFVHVYLFAMVVVIAVAFAIQLWLHRQITWGTAWRWFGSMVMGTLVLLAGNGLIGATASSAGGFGTYSMNLLALVAKQPDGTGGQYEGFSYLGLGVIGLLAIHIYSSRSLIWRSLRGYRAPMVAICLMALFALSWWIWLGDQPLVMLPRFGPIEWLGDRFRASGRFVWPLVYVLTAGAIVLTVRRFRSQTATALLLGALAIQILDMGTTAVATHDALREREPQFLDSAAWAGLIGQHSLVRATPHACVVESRTSAYASREVQRITGQLGVPITTAAAARQAGDCDDPMISLPLVVGELRIVWNDRDDFYRPPEESSHCVDLSLGTVCSRRVFDPGTVERLDRSVTVADYADLSPRR
jgi:hypothetical protein